MLHQFGNLLFSSSVMSKVGAFYYRLLYFFRHGTFDFFYGVEVETTTACNLRCSYCPNSKFTRSLFENKKDMKLELYHKIVDELAGLKYKGRFSLHFYGEPLMDVRLPELVAYAKGKLKNANIVLFTNGELLTISKYNALTNAGVKKFVVTQHLSKESSNIKNILTYRKINGRKGIIFEYVKLKKENMTNRGGLVNVTQKRIKYCRLPSDNFVIDYNGNVVLCCNDYLSSVKFGNINSEKIIDVWNEDFYKRIRYELRKGIFTLNVCKNEIKLINKNR